MEDDAREGTYLFKTNITGLCWIERSLETSIYNFCKNEIHDERELRQLNTENERKQEINQNNNDKI